MKRKLDFSTLVLLVNVPPEGYVPLLGELNELRRQIKGAKRVKIASQHKAWPIIKLTAPDDRADLLTLDYDSWFLWASVLEGEGYGHSVIVVPVNGVEAYRMNNETPKACTVSKHITLACLDVGAGDTQALLGFVYGWISAPRTRFEPLDLKPDSSFGRSIIQLISSASNVVGEGELMTPPVTEAQNVDDVASKVAGREGEPLMTSGQTDATSMNDARPNIECIGIDGVPVTSRTLGGDS